jgi:hypothetical protein
MTVVVFDARPALEREHSLPPEVDKELGQIMRDELLFEQYGGQIAEDGVNPETTNDGRDDSGPDASATPEEVEEESIPGHDDSFAVPAFVAASTRIKEPLMRRPGAHMPIYNRPGAASLTVSSLEKKFTPASSPGGGNTRTARLNIADTWACARRTVAVEAMTFGRTFFPFTSHVAR